MAKLHKIVNSLHLSSLSILFLFVCAIPQVIVYGAHAISCLNVTYLFMFLLILLVTLVFEKGFSLATIGLAFILHSQFLSMEFVSNICALGLTMVGLAFFSTSFGLGPSCTKLYT